MSSETVNGEGNGEENGRVHTGAMGTGGNGKILERKNQNNLMLTLLQWWCCRVPSGSITLDRRAYTERGSCLLVL